MKIKENCIVENEAATAAVIKIIPNNAKWVVNV